MSKTNDVIDKLRPFLSEQRAERIEEVLSNRLGGIRVLLERFYDHGNIVAVMRTCEAFGVSGVDLLEFGPSFKPAKKMSQGAHKWLDVREHENPAQAVKRLKEQGFRIVGSDVSGPRTLEEIDVSSPFALIFGNEHEGISPEMKGYCDEMFHIPMRGYTQSLNVSCAAAIALHVVTQRYRDAIAARGDLSDDQKATLRAVYYRRAVKNSELHLSNQGHRGNGA